MNQGEQKIRVLLVEDEKKLAHSIERQLVRAGYTVELAFDGIEAEEKVRTRELELIIVERTVLFQSPARAGLFIWCARRAQSLRALIPPEPILPLLAIRFLLAL